jgi:NADH:ubiquinone oxidoreductase subunit H
MFILTSSIDQEKTLIKVLNFDKINSCFSQAYEYFNPINGAALYSLKLSIAILFLLLMRGGTPRYRYDYLTKLG